jgi:hypothetical protein
MAYRSGSPPDDTMFRSEHPVAHVLHDVHVVRGPRKDVGLVHELVQTPFASSMKYGSRPPIIPSKIRMSPGSIGLSAKHVLRPHTKKEHDWKT